MKAYPLISLLAVALVANAQSSDSNSGAPTGPSSPLSDTGCPATPIQRRSHRHRALLHHLLLHPLQPLRRDNLTPTPSSYFALSRRVLSTGTDSAGNAVTVELPFCNPSPISLQSICLQHR
ncbi:hypothetical protein B0H13DRAFT_46598 [Mycena leptocephala]|nr:hypothetical protein B0H13DRAFT_46598 [Mycena leptocephala]